MNNKRIGHEHFTDATERPNKEKESAEIDQQIKEFLKKGGKIKKIKSGETSTKTENLTKHQKQRFGVKDEY